MARSAVKRISERGATRATDLAYADAIVRKATDIQLMAEDQLAVEAEVSGLSSQLENANLVPNDGIPPGLAQNVLVDPFIHELIVRWGDPPELDYVETSRIRVTPQGEAARIFEGGTIGGSGINLPGKPCTVEVQLIDVWGLVSGWTAPITATPLLTAAESIDLAQIALNGRLTGLLPNANLAPIGDSSKFAEGVVNEVALAAGRNANVLPFDEAEFENWAAAQTWPPPGVAAFIATGNTGTVVDVSGRKWLELFRGSATEPWQFIRSGARRRGTIPGQTYILSCYVRNATATAWPTSLQVKDSATDGGATLDKAGGTVTTIPADGKEYRVSVKWTVDPARPFFEWWLNMPTLNSRLQVSRFQLEPVAATKTEPGPYSIPSVTFGAMSGRLLAVMDAAIVSAVIGTAAIDTAQIKTLVVDKLAAGTFSAGTILLSGAGKLSASGNTVLDATGIKLTPTTSFSEPAASLDFKISASTNIAAMNFYNLAGTANHRGIVLRADGNGAGTLRGNIVLDSTYGTAAGPGATSAANLNVRSSVTGETARVWVRPRLEVDGTLEATFLRPYFYFEGNVSATSTVIFSSTGASTAGVIVSAQLWDTTNNSWVNLPTVGASPVFLLRNELLNGTIYISIKNDRGSQQLVRASVWQRGAA